MNGVSVVADGLSAREHNTVDVSFPLIGSFRAEHPGVASFKADGDVYKRQLVKLLGFDYVDIGMLARSSHFSPLELQTSPQAYTAQVLRDLNAAELSVSDVFVQIGVDPSECATNDPSPEVRSKSRDVFKHALDFCVELGCSLSLIHI